MDSRKLLPTIIALLLTLPAFSIWAADIGEAVLQSGPGKPLQVQVELRTSPGEALEDACLTLLPPDPLNEEIGSFLTDAHLTLKRLQQRTFVDITSNVATGNAPIRLKLQVKCPNTQGIVKTLAASPAGRPLELAALTEKLLQLETDFQALQQQSQRVQDQITELKQQMAALQGTAAPPSPQAAPQTAPVPAAKPGGAVPIRQYSQYLPRHTAEALGLLMILFALWLSVHYYARMKAHLAPLRPATPPQNKWTADAIRHPAKPGEFHPDAASAPPGGPVSLDMTGKTAAQDAAMLEEAGLYIAVGRLPKAIDLLQEIIRRSPGKTDAWSLLFSIYSSLGKAGEFEKSANAFLKQHENSSLWRQIQVLGRTLDPSNPLYADAAKTLSATPLLPDDLHHPIGDVLIEMGALSKSEIMRYLDEFDPKIHGRFGGYLVSRKAITLAQLDDALLRQQGVHAEAKPGELPSLQDIENFLAVYDPKRDGSVGSFMAAHHAATPEQISRALKRQTAKDAPPGANSDRASTS